MTPLRDGYHRGNPGQPQPFGTGTSGANWGYGTLSERGIANKVIRFSIVPGNNATKVANENKVFDARL